MDVERLKRDLKDYFGTGAFNVAPAMMMNVFDIDNASIQKLKELAAEAGLDIRDYEDDLER